MSLSLFRLMMLVVFGVFTLSATAQASDPSHGAAAEDSGEPEIQFVQLDTMLLPVMDEQGISQVVTLVVSLEVADSETADQAKKLSPRLKDAFIQDMYGQLHHRALLRNGVLAVGAIKARMNHVSNKVLGEGQVNDVLLQVVQQRRI